MKKFIIIILISTNLFSQKQMTEVYTKIAIDKLNSKDLVFQYQIETNFARIFSYQKDKFLMFPQLGNECLQFNSKEELDNMIKFNAYPILDEREIIYHNKNILKFNNNVFALRDSVKKHIYNVFNLENDTLDLNEKLGVVELKFKKLIGEDKTELFPYFLIYFCDFFQKDKVFKIVSEKQLYLKTFEMPYLYDCENDISLEILNALLEEKFTNKSKITFKDILIRVYCNYFEYKFFATNQNNYFDKKDYKKLLTNDFDKYFVFPFVDIWNLPKIGR